MVDFSRRETRQELLIAGSETSKDQRNGLSITTLNVKGGTAFTLENDCDGVVIDGFSIQTGNPAIVCDSVGSPIISHNTISCGITAIHVGSGSPYILYNNISSNLEGIEVLSSSAPTIANNIISGYSQSGITLNTTQAATIVNNTFVGNGSSTGFNCGSMDIVANNIVTSNSVGVYCEAGDNFKNNDVYGNTTNYSGTAPTGNGNISVDPDFVDSANGDYHLTSTSLCIDAGYDGAVQSDWTDIDGKLRKVNIRNTGSLVDIGADEYTPLTVTISKASDQPNPTKSSTINFTVTFSEAVTGFENSDVTLSGTAGAATAQVSDSGDHITYNVAVSGMTSSAGTVIASIPADVAQDSAEVWNDASDNTGNTNNVVLFDGAAPTLDTFSVPTYSGSNIQITYNASDTGGSGIKNVELYYIADQAYYLGNSGGLSSGVFTVNTSVEGSYEFAAQAVDNAGNLSDVGVCTTTVDLTPPTQPTNLVVDHIIPTSTLVNASWNASTDSASGVKNYDYQFWYKTSTGGPYALTGVLTTTNTNATYNLDGYLAVDPNTTIGIRVWARDYVGNVRII